MAAAHVSPAKKTHRFGEPPPEDDGIPEAPVMNLDMDDSDKGWRDVPWFILFYVHVIVIAVLAFAIGIPEAQDAADSSSNSSGEDNGDTDIEVDGRVLLGVLAAVAFASVFISFGWIYFLMKHAKTIIPMAVIMNIALYIVGFIVIGAVTGQWIGAAFGFGIPAAIMICWYFCVRRGIPFAAATLEVSCQAVLQYKCSFGFAFFSLGVELAWIILWALATIGVGERINNFAITVVFLISFYWGTTVVKNVVHTTVAGTVGTWWAVKDPQDPTWNAFKRAAGKSFGSIALISLIIAIVKTLRYLSERARREAEGGMAIFWACVRCLVTILLRLLEYFSDYALVHVALYGKALVPAAKDTWNMFKERGWDAIINDSLIGVTLTISSLIVGVVSLVVGLVIGFFTKGESEDETTFMVLVGILSFVIGYGMCVIMAGVIDSAVKTVFVCFGDAPEALRQTHHDAFKVLYPAWVERYPEEMQSSGYTQKYQEYNPASFAYTPAQ